jgi:hypothetical protein
LLVELTTARPLVLSMTPPLMTKVPAVAPRAAALLMLSVPALRMTPPSKVLVPERVRVPAPALVMPKVGPDTEPLTPRLLAPSVTVQVWAAPRAMLLLIVTAPAAPLAMVMPVLPLPGVMVSVLPLMTTGAVRVRSEVQGLDGEVLPESGGQVASDRAWSC